MPVQKLAIMMLGLDFFKNVNDTLGHAVYLEHGSDGDVLMRNADIAMYRVKEAGRNSYQIYSEKP